MKSKSLIVFLFCIVSFLSAAARPEREVVIGKKNALTLKPDNYEIVIPENACQVVKWTSTEMAGLLKEIFGVEPAVVTKPTGKIPINLGMDLCNLDEATIAKLKDVRDSYYIAVSNKGVFIGGYDDENKNPVQALNKEGVWGNLYARSTMMGCYDFLERFFGVRFYFPGKLGTITPQKKECRLKECRIFERPDFITRRYSAFWDGAYFEGENRTRALHPGRILQMYRNRSETQDIPFCHGTNAFNYLWRFKDTHPEYFALLSNGKRYCDPSMQHPGQLCYSSGITEELYQDVKAVFTGQPASSRGMVDQNGKPMKNWSYNCRWNKYVDIMPQDSYTECHCEKCQAAYEKEKGHSGYASELVWKYVTDIGNRLKKENIKGEITMMAYWPYRDLPQKVKIPDNVNIMFATASGPFRGGTMDPKERDEIMKWINATNKKVWFWTYVCKSGVLNHLTRGVPNPCPRTVGKFYSENAYLINGGFMENETDRFLYQAINNYVFSRVCWDNKWDTAKALKEYYQLMFGKAAPEMKSIMEDFEDTWLQKITGRVTFTALGPVNSPPSSYELWTKIYNKEKLASIKARFDAAASKVKPDSLEAERIALFVREFYDPLAQAHDDYVSRLSAISYFKFKISDTMGEPVYLQPFKYKKGELVSTAVTFAYENDELHVRYVCEEPYMDKLVAAKREYDDYEVWKDNSVELFFNPSGDRKVTYQFVVNSEGSLTDWKSISTGSKTQGDISWKSNARCKITKEEKQWIAELFIPLSNFPELDKNKATINFCRGRFVGVTNVHVLYTFSPFVNFFHDFENYAIISYDMNQLVKNNEFNTGRMKNSARHYGGYVGKGKDYHYEGWITNKEYIDNFALDNEVFFTAPSSLRIENKQREDGSSPVKYLSITNWIALKPSTKYRLSYMVKLKDVVPFARGGGFLCNIYDAANLWFPQPALAGTLDEWISQSFEFTTNPETGSKVRPYMGLCIHNATGTVWVDHVVVEEIK